jgi:hypothetical protein
MKSPAEVKQEASEEATVVDLIEVSLNNNYLKVSIGQVATEAYCKLNSTLLFSVTTSLFASTRERVNISHLPCE